jgi:hypothetical protein
MADLYSGVKIVESSDDQEKTGSIHEIILRHISKLGEICTHELTGGYWQKRPIKTGGGVVIAETYHEDTREAYCLLVKYLCHLVYPMSDKDFKKFVDDINTNWKGKTIPIEERLDTSMEIFSEMNIMFNRINFFESSEDIALR